MRNGAASCRAIFVLSYLLFPTQFYFAVLLFILLNAAADEDQYLAVGGPSFIIRYHVELVQKFRLYPNGKALCDHKTTPKQIYYVFILESACAIMWEMDM